MQKCGIYLQRGRIVAAALFVPMLILFIFSDKMLLALKMDAKVVPHAWYYIMGMAPSVFLIGQHDIQRKFLTSTGHAEQQMKVQIVCTVIHLGFNLVFVSWLGLNIIGVCIATLLTNILVLLLNIYMTWQVDEL